MPENFDLHSWFYRKYLEFRRSYETIWKPYLEYDIAQESCFPEKDLNESYWLYTLKIYPV